MKQAASFLVVLSALAAGCVAPTLEPAALAGASGLLVDGLAVPAGEAFAWKGRELAGPRDPVGDVGDLARCLAAADCPTADAPCEEARCERRELKVASAGRLVVGLRWPSIDGVWLSLAIEDASGARVALGKSITVDHNGAVAIVEDAKPGRYHVVVSAARGSSDYEAAARLAPAERARESGDLLPDIVTLPPTDLTFEDPPGHYLLNLVALPTNDVARAMGARACSTDEAAQGARRCLRFSNAVANVGEGPLDVALSFDAAATYPTGGRFVQRIALAEGGVRERAAGPAEFHAIHGHWHNAGANEFAIYRFDEETRARGERVAEGRKTGMCFADVGIVDPASAPLELPAHQGAQCFNPAIEREWNMGLSSGWYDLYPWLLNDQYVDVAGVENGTYLLCSIANAHAFLAEAREDNNEGCTAFRLTDDAVEALDPPPYHARPEIS